MPENCPHCGSAFDLTPHKPTFSCGSYRGGPQSDQCRMIVLEQERNRYAAALREISKSPIGYGEVDETFGNRTACPECEAMVEIARRALDPEQTQT